MIRNLKIEDGSSWPDPRDVADFEYVLRYGKDEDILKARMELASVANAYFSLASRPEFRGKPLMLRRAMRENP